MILYLLKCIKMKRNNHMTENYILLTMTGIILLLYYLFDKNQNTERYWSQKSRPIYDIIKYTKLILTITFVLNIKFFLANLYKK